jgi:D-alanyl-lipoteichoic acid acyltransferase DltB (MBOAT superfamily)
MNWGEIGKQFLYIEDQPLLFHQGMFLLLFSVFLIGYSFVAKNKSPREYFIIIFSAYFYYKSSGIFILLLLTTISADYLFSIWLEREENERKRKWILAGAILFSLSFLLYFKYKNFFISNFDALSGSKHTLGKLILPIGISFYTFQSISYLVDIANRNIKRPVFQNYLMYMMFFPHLVAGPIVRARDFLPQLTRKFSLRGPQFNEAFYLILKGLIKKAIIADFVAQYADIVFSAPAGFSGSELILASLCYTLQIFCDFSGYTDMAIGIALLLGYRLCLNFDSPYKAIDITNFWRRWHISLSSWLRDYIYIPLGGNQKGFLLQLLFLMVTMLAGGFWHGADWKFVFWGAGHGTLLVLHKLWVKYFGKQFESTWFNGFSWFLTFACVSLLWIPFRAVSMDSTWEIYKRIFTSVDLGMVWEVMKTNPTLIFLLVVGYASTLLTLDWKDKIVKYVGKQDLLVKFLLLIFVVQLMIQLRSTVVQPFIYFQF